MSRVDTCNIMLNVLDARWALLINISSNKLFLQQQLYQHEFTKSFFNSLVYDETQQFDKAIRKSLIYCLFDYIFKDILEKHLDKSNIKEAKSYLSIEKNFLMFFELEYGSSSSPKAKDHRINIDDVDEIPTEADNEVVKTADTKLESTPAETGKESVELIQVAETLTLMGQESTPDKTKVESIPVEKLWNKLRLKALYRIVYFTCFLYNI